MGRKERKWLAERGKRGANLIAMNVHNSCISAPCSEESWFLGGTSNTEYGRCKLSIIIVITCMYGFAKYVVYYYDSLIFDSSYHNILSDDGFYPITHISFVYYGRDHKAIACQY